MATFHEYYDEIELDDGRTLRIEFGQFKTPATFEDPAEVETTEYKVYLDRQRVYNEDLGELAHIAQELFENGDPAEWFPDRYP